MYVKIVCDDGTTATYQCVSVEHKLLTLRQAESLGDLIEEMDGGNIEDLESSCKPPWGVARIELNKNVKPREPGAQSAVGGKDASPSTPEAEKHTVLCYTDCRVFLLNEIGNTIDRFNVHAAVYSDGDRDSRSGNKKKSW